MSARDAVPDRDGLIRQIQAANRAAWPWVIVQFVLCVVMAWQIDWSQVVDAPFFSLLIVATVIGPQVMSVLRQWALNKKEIGLLKETTKFGEYDKQRLRELVNNTLDRLGLPRPGPPVYITADKSLNAGALQLGLAGFFRSLNGVYLNRQVLHRLTPQEVQDIIGHELGHYYFYFLVNNRFRGLTLVLGALSGMLVTQWIGLSSMFIFVALSGCGMIFWIVAGYLTARNGAAIEYLCDDLGAQVHGVVVSINGLLKVGVDGELNSAIHQQHLLTQKQPNLTPAQIIEAIEIAIPWGHTTREELEQAVAASLRKRSLEARQLSLKGFWDYAWQGDGQSDELDDAMKKIRRLQSVPRLEWEQLLDRPGEIALNERQAAVLVEMLEKFPQLVLFRLPAEIGESNDVHPSIRARILYLWKNRAEIAAQHAITRW